MDSFDLNDFSFDDLEDFASDGTDYFEDTLLAVGSSAKNSLSFALSNFSRSVSDHWEDKHFNSSRKRKAENLEYEQRHFKLPRPRAVKSDPRRAFPNIWANVFNSANFDYMMIHIKDFCDGNVSVLERDLRLSKRVFSRTVVFEPAA